MTSWEGPGGARTRRRKPLSWRAVGDRAFLCVLGDSLDSAVSEEVLNLSARIKEAAIPGVVGVIPAYASVLVEVGPEVARPRDILRALESASAGGGDNPPPRRSRWVHVPVCYGGDFGPDLGTVADTLGLSPALVIHAHARSYRVFCLGFAPGFPLAGPLPKTLELPRREIPRVRVPPGSVAIAGRQTGIYPVASAGGWHILGRTPWPLFAPEAVPPVPWSAGDQIVFEPITPEMFHRLAGQPAAWRIEEAPACHGVV